MDTTVNPRGRSASATHRRLTEEPKPAALWADGCIYEYDDEGPETPEEIEAWLRWYHSLEPIVITPEEEAAWEADRQTQKEFDNATAAEPERRIVEIFE